MKEIRLSAMLLALLKTLAEIRNIEKIQFVSDYFEKYCEFYVNGGGEQNLSFPVQERTGM